MTERFLICFPIGVFSIANSLLLQRQVVSICQRHNSHLLRLPRPWVAQRSILPTAFALRSLPGLAQFPPAEEHLELKFRGEMDSAGIYTIIFSHIQYATVIITADSQHLPNRVTGSSASHDTWRSATDPVRSDEEVAMSEEKPVVHAAKSVGKILLVFIVTALIIIGGFIINFLISWNQHPILW